MNQMKWRPIDTAPKDGSEILSLGLMSEGLMDAERRPLVLSISWKEHEGYDDYEEQPCGLFKKVRKPGLALWRTPTFFGSFTPTHWMPLPKAPRKEKR